MKVTSGARSFIVIFLINALLAALPSPANAAPLCATEGPQSVLECYSAAYANRDLEAFVMLLDPEFTSTDTTNRSSSFDYDQIIDTTRRMFEAPNIKHLSLTFGEGYRIEVGDETGTWILKDIPCSITVEATPQKGKPGVFTVHKLATLWVRKIEDPEPHFVMYREELREASGQ